MKKIVTILGARPQFIKAAVLSRLFKDNNEIQEVILHTGQHFDANMSAVFFEEMQIPKPKYHLNINAVTHGAMTGRMLEKIAIILSEENPEAVLVYGDTNSTLAGALAAKKLGIQVIHIEAGLRSFDIKMPEEINRILTDRISDLLCCPTDMAVQNLKKEGFNNFPVMVKKTGDIMKDALTFYRKIALKKSSIIKKLSLEENNFVLATIHRQENTDDPKKLIPIFEALQTIHREKQVVLPLHPRTKKRLESYGFQPKLTVIQPVGYFDMLALLKNCLLVITDSGGLQKEAFFNKKYSIIAREATEWTELVENGFAQTVGNDKESILDLYKKYKNTSINFDKTLYGNKVGECIYKAIIELLNT